jgi:hypothetical protein
MEDGHITEAFCLECGRRPAGGCFDLNLGVA